MHSDHGSSSTLREFWRHTGQTISRMHSGRRHGHFRGSRLSGVDKEGRAYGSIHYDIGIAVDVFDEGVTMSAPCRSGEA